MHHLRYPISVAATAPDDACLSTAAPAQAPGLFKADQDAGFYRKKRHHRNYSRDQRVSSNTRIWRGSDGRYRCKKDNGTTGLLLGGAVRSEETSVGKEGVRTCCSRWSACH